MISTICDRCGEKMDSPGPLRFTVPNTAASARALQNIEISETTPILKLTCSVHAINIPVDCTYDICLSCVQQLVTDELYRRTAS